MKWLMTMIQMGQDINVEEHGISYAEEGFTQLYEEALRVNAKYKTDINLATGKGLIIGAALTGLGMYGYNQFKKHRLKDKRMSIEELEKIGIKPIKPETFVTGETNWK